MDLLDRVQIDRAGQRRKKPIARDVFRTVACIVKKFGLTEGFLQQLEETENVEPGSRYDCTRAQDKRALDLPPFCLLSKPQYDLAGAIVSRLGNPYLAFAHTPEEMLWSAPLYAANPSLTPEDLQRFDFETLLLVQHAGNGLPEPRSQPEGAGTTATEHRGGEACPVQQRDPVLDRERASELQTSLERVADTESLPK